MEKRLWIVAILSATISGLFSSSQAVANLCQLDKLNDRYRQEAALITGQAFTATTHDYQGIGGLS